MPMALIGITVQTMQIPNDRLHKADDKKNIKREEKKKWTITNAYKWFRDDPCYQYYMALEIHIPGQVYTLDE